MKLNISHNGTLKVSVVLNPVQQAIVESMGITEKSIELVYKCDDIVARDRAYNAVFEAVNAGQAPQDCVEHLMSDVEYCFHTTLEYASYYMDFVIYDFEITE